MDPDPSNDIHMEEGDILNTTESNGIAFPPLTSQTRPKALSRSRDSSVKAHSVTTLKGAGVKRETDVFDYALTKRKDAPRPPKFKSLPYATSQTGLVYDVRMRFHVEDIPTDEEIHPEDPRRIHAIYEAFVDAGLAWQEGAEEPTLDFFMGRIDTRKVTKEEVCLVHTKRHWEWIQELAEKSPAELTDTLQHEGCGMDSVYLSPMTPYCAALSAGGAIEACRAVMLGKVKNVFAIIRPPGHHAEREDVKGFCFYDNVSIATKVCQREFGEQCRKVMILDWDVHHGNGIQQANYDDPNVLYMSLHVHENGRFYPEHSYRDNRRAYGDHLHCGTGAGLGTNVNVPWSKMGMGDADYIYAFQQVIMPIATEFNPDLVIIAAGFDAADGDMLGKCHVTPAGYAHMTHMLMSLADGKVVTCLEGGYNLESIARSATAVARTLMGEPPERLATLNPTTTAVNDIKLVLRQQSRFWSSLYPKDPSLRIRKAPHGERMHDVIRQWQASKLWDDYEMTSLFVHKERLSKSFENQVLATSNYMTARPLLVILHDPPEMLASPDPRTGKVELHNTYLTDTVKTYVDWAVKQKFAVIDVNLPKHVTDVDDSLEHEEHESIEYRTKEATQLLTYLWDNYIELNSSTHLFLLGTNIGHGAIVQFIKANDERKQEHITSVISIVGNVPLLSCKSQTNDTLAPWYRANSLVFVAPEHNFWASELSIKPKRGFGRVTKSECDDPNDILIEQRDTICNHILSKTAGWESRVDAADVMEASDGETPTSPKQLLPPVGNFALSPRPNNSAGFSSPRGRQARTPRTGSPTTAQALNAFSSSPR